SRGAGEQDRSPDRLRVFRPGEHTLGRFTPDNETAETRLTPCLLELRDLDVDYTLPHSATRVENDQVRRAEVVRDSIEQGAHLGFVGGVATVGHSASAEWPDFGRDRFYPLT